MHKQIELVEYVPLFLNPEELSPELGAAIFTRLSRYIDIEFPTPRTRGKWRLMSKGSVGALNPNHEATIHLLPRISISNVMSMWEYAYHLRGFEKLNGMVQCETISGFFNRVAWILANLVIERGKRGLYKTYIETVDRGGFVRGKVDLKDALAHPGTPYVRCVYHDISTNNIHNQIILWTLTMLSRTDDLQGSRGIVNRAIRLMRGHVDVVPIGYNDCSQVYNMLNRDYEVMHALCRFILEAVAPYPIKGLSPILPFVINMGRLFELFVAEWLKINLPTNLGLEVQETVACGERGNEINFTIDLVVYEKSGGSTLCVIDTKYKFGDRPEKADIHQILSYMEVKRCNKGILLYPSNLNDSRVYRINAKSVYQVRMDIENDLKSAGAYLLSVLRLIQG